MRYLDFEKSYGSVYEENFIHGVRYTHKTS